MNSRPLIILEDEGFCLLNFEVAPKYNNVTRSMVQTGLHGILHSIEKKMVSDLPKASSLSMTTDVWTDSTGSPHASFTVHFGNEEWKLASHLLACSKLNGRNTGSELASFLVRIAKKYGILKKLLFVSVDNSSNAKLQVEMSA